MNNKNKNKQLNYKIMDERIEMQKLKINSEAFHLLTILLTGSIFIQYFFAGRPAHEFYSEFICMLAAGLYTILKMVHLGITTFENNKKTRSKVMLKVLLYSGFCTAIAIFIYGYGFKDLKNLLIILSIFVVFNASVYYLIPVLAKKNQDKISEELEKEQ